MPSNINLASVSKHKHVRKKLLNLLTQLIQFTDQQIQLKKQQPVEINLSIYVSTKYLPIQTIFVYLDIFKMYELNYRPDLKNLQTRRKNLKV